MHGLNGEIQWLKHSVLLKNTFDAPKILRTNNVNYVHKKMNSDTVI